MPAWSRKRRRWPRKQKSKNKGGARGKVIPCLSNFSSVFIMVSGRNEASMRPRRRILHRVCLRVRQHPRRSRIRRKFRYQLIVQLLLCAVCICMILSSRCIAPICILPHVCNFGVKVEYCQCCQLECQAVVGESTPHSPNNWYFPTTSTQCNYVIGLVTWSFTRLS